MRTPCWLSLLILVICLKTTFASEQPGLQSWTHDADQLSELLLKEHPAPAEWADRHDVLRQLTQTRNVLESTADRETRTAAILAAVASLKDGHSMVDSESRYDVFGYAGFSCEVFDDGVFLVRVPEDAPELLGAEILSIGNVSIADSLDRLKPYVPHAVDSRFRRWACAYLHLPGLLHSIGITDDASVTSITLKQRDESVTTHEFWRQSLTESEQTRRIGLEALNLPDRLREKHDQSYYGFELLDDSRTMYLDYNRIGNDESEPYWEFDTRFFKALDDSEASRLIIDLRDNGGGGYQYSVWLVSGILARSRFLEPGGLIVLTEKRTFSAAMQLLNDLQSRAGALVIGGNTGDRPHAPGDAKSRTLPDSGVQLELSTRFHRSSYPQDDRLTFDPDIRIPDRFEDRLHGRDPALDYARNHSLTGSVTEHCNEKSRPLGRYDFGGGAHLVVACSVRGTLQAAVAGVLETDLNMIHGSLYDSRIPGLRFLLNDAGPARLISPSGRVTELSRIEGDELSLWERLYQGDTLAVRQAMIALASSDPEDPRMSDASLTSEAINVYYAIKQARGRDSARSATAELLNTCIEIHADQAENCRFSLRFYQ